MNARTLTAATASLALLAACGGMASSSGSGGGACAASCTGTCVSGRCRVVLAPGQMGPVSIAVGPGAVYWGSAGAVMEDGLDGGPPATLASGQDGLASIALAGDRVAWTSVLFGTSGAIQSLATDGTGEPLSLASGAWDLPYPRGAVGHAGSVLWVARKLSNGALVMKAPIPGGAPVTLATISNALAHPEGIATDAAGNAYWTDSGTDTVEKVVANGGPVVTLASKQAFPTGIAVAGTNVYWTDRDGGTVMTIPTSPASGALPSTLASGQDQPTRIAVDASHVYWVNSGAETLMRLPLAGGKAVKLVSGKYIRDIAVDQTSVYWTDTWAGTVNKLTPK